MTVTPHQTSQIGILLGHAFLEIQLLIAQKRDKAASGLAYACHNLPSLNPAHFEWNYFRRQFSFFHKTHGMVLYNYSAILDLIEAEVGITFENATVPLAENPP